MKRTSTSFGVFFFPSKLAEEDLLLGEPCCSYLSEQRFYLDPDDPPAGYKCETFRPVGQSCGVGESAGVKGVRAIRCPHLCCQLMPGH